MGGEPELATAPEIMLKRRRQRLAVGISTLAAVVHRIKHGVHKKVVVPGFPAIQTHHFLASTHLLPKAIWLKQRMGRNSLLPPTALIPSQWITELCRQLRPLPH